MATPSSEPPSSPWAPFIFGGIFLVAAALIFAGVMYHPPPDPDSAPGSAPDGAAPSPMPTLPLHYPATRTVDASDTFFGTKVPDPYRWLEDSSSSEVKAWMDAQNHLARSYLDALPGRAALAQRYG